MQGQKIVFIQFYFLSNHAGRKIASGWHTNYPSAQTENNVNGPDTAPRSVSTSDGAYCRKRLGWYEGTHVLIPPQMHALMTAGKLMTSAL